MFTQFPSPVRRATACRSHDYQVTLKLPLHTFRGPGATPHGQVFLSDRFRQTLLTTSLEVVQAVIYDRVLEAGIYINLAHSFTQSMTTIPRMIVLRCQDSPEHDPQRSAPRCWIHHELVFHSNFSHDSCTTPRNDLCGAFFLSKTR